MLRKDISKEEILKLLDSFVRQRPGLEFGNYGEISSYRAELRQITKDRHDAERLLSFVAIRDSITAAMLLDGFRAFSGRLTIDIDPNRDRPRLDYCTGQYFPTEYRKAVCAVLAATIWGWMREQNMQSAGDWLRTKFRREFGRSMAQRWFS